MNGKIYRIIQYGIIILCMAFMIACDAEKEQLNPDYLDRFDFAVDRMSDKEYDEAKDILLDLTEELEQNSDTQSEQAIELKADINYALGQLHINKGEYGKAYDYYSEAYAYYKDALDENDPKIVDTRFQLASVEDAYLYREEHALSEFIDIYENINIPKYRNAALCNIISIYLYMDSGAGVSRYIGGAKELIGGIAECNDESLKSLIKGDGEASELQRDAVLGRITNADQFLYAYDVLGSYYVEYDNPDKALEMYEVAIELMDRAEIEDEKERINFYESIGFVNLYFKGEVQGNDYINKAVDIIDKFYPEGTEKAGSYINIAEMYLSMGDYDRFGSFLEDAVGMAERTAGDNHHDIALSKTLLSQYYRRIGEYQRAIACCEDSIEISKNLLEEDQKSLGSAYNNLANCYADGGYKEKSIEAYLKSIEIFKGYNDDLQVAVADRNIALIYNNSLYEHDLAMEYAREAISIVDKMDESYFGGTIAAIYMVLPDIIESTDPEYGMIEEYCEKAYKRLLSAAGNVDEEVANYHYNLGMFLSENVRYDEALEHFLEAEPLFEEVYIETKLYPVDIFYDIAYCHYYIGNYDESMDYFKKSVDYNDKHIALLHGQGIYRTGYWEERLDESRYYIGLLEDMD